MTKSENVVIYFLEWSRLRDQNQVKQDGEKPLLYRVKVCQRKMLTFTLPFYSAYPCYCVRQNNTLTHKSSRWKITNNDVLIML